MLSAARPEGIAVREIIAATGMSRRWVFYRLQQMAAEGLAIQTARGYWRAAP
jgi:S-DNA-T family DNA segregation ATPase FtsK/SpoIIIE